MQNTVNVVKQHGARDIYISCTHPAFCGPAVQRLSALPLKEIVCTNTMPLPAGHGMTNVTVLSMAPLLSEVMLRVHEGRSVGALFNE
jgi:ribose-phosphate pyrophosphokinase